MPVVFEQVSIAVTNMTAGRIPESDGNARQGNLTSFVGELHGGVEGDRSLRTEGPTAACAVASGTPASRV